MKHSSRQYAQALYDTVADKTPTQTTALVNNFLQLLSANNDLAKLPEIMSFFTDIWQQANGQLSASIATAQPLTIETLKNITNYIKNQTDCKDIKNIIWQQDVDPQILGGVLIKYRDQIIDGTIKNNLLRLKNKLVN